MSRPIAVLRPEPGNRVTAAGIEERGFRAIRLPLFEVHSVAWTVPNAARFDALVLTSANALRHGGEGLERLRALPVFAVGQATAQAAQRAGFAVRACGDSGAQALVAQAEAMGVRHALHLAGRDRTLEPGGVIAQIETVYASEPLEVAVHAMGSLRGSVALLQSARAGARLAELADESLRAQVTILAVSAAVAQAAGRGWERCDIAPAPDADTLIRAAIALAD